MARTTPVIAVVGAGLLLAAVATATIRGLDDGDTTAAPDPTSTAAATDDQPTGDTPASPSPTATATAEPSPGDDEPTTAAPTEDTPTDDAPTDDAPTDDAPTGVDDPDAVFVPTAPPLDGDADDTPGAGDDGTDDDGDEGTAMGPTTLGETPSTGGGTLAALGGAVAAGALVAGRRRTG